MPLTVGPRRVAPAGGSTSITILNAVLAAKDRTTEARQRPPTGYIAVMMGGGAPAGRRAHHDARARGLCHRGPSRRGAYAALLLVL